jgi:hypothetical protein
VNKKDQYNRLLVTPRGCDWAVKPEKKLSPKRDEQPMGRNEEEAAERASGCPDIQRDGQLPIE